MFSAHTVSIISFYVVSLTFEVDARRPTYRLYWFLQHILDLWCRGACWDRLKTLGGGPSFSLIYQGIPRFIDRNKRLAKLASVINVLLWIVDSCHLRLLIQYSKIPSSSAKCFGRTKYLLAPKSLHWPGTFCRALWQDATPSFGSGQK